MTATNHPPAPTALRHRFRAMATDVELQLLGDRHGDATRHFAAAEAEVHRLAAVFTRFDADSELSRLNHQRRLHCSPELVEVVELALAARDATDGIFDPTLHDAMVAAGYDRDFTALRAAGARSSAPPPRRGNVHVDPTAGIIQLTGTVRLDLGGIAKGWIADRALELLAPAGPALVNAGGDIAMSLTGPPHPRWTIEVPLPTGRVVLEVDGGGLATSGIDRRWWRDVGTGARHHHVIDPRTSTPSATDLVRATVVAASCAEAEVHATHLLVLGARAARLHADRLGLPAVLVHADGTTTLTGGLSWTNR